MKIPAGFFIFGPPRTGTTLLRRLLTAQGDVAIPPESYFFADYLRANQRLPLAQLTTWLLDDPELLDWRLQLSRDFLASSPSLAESIARLHYAYALQNQRRRWGNKTPRLLRLAPQLAALYPDAKFVLCMREPNAVARSLAASAAHRQNAWAAARRWRQDAERAWRFCQQQGGTRVHVVRYEALLANPACVARQLCDFLDLEFREAMLTAIPPLPLTAIETVAGHHARIAQPLAAAAPAALSPVTTAIVAALTAELAAAWGYAPAMAWPVRRWRLALLALGQWIREIKKAAADVWRRPHWAAIARRQWRLGAMRRRLQEQLQW